MKKILVILACVAMLFSFASCDNGSTAASAKISDSYLAGQVIGKVFGAGGALENSFMAIETAAKGADATVTSTSVSAEVPATITLDSGFTLVSSDFSFTLENTDQGTADAPKTAITAGRIDGTVVFFDAMRNDYAVKINGNVDVKGTLSIETKDGKSTVSAVTVTGVALPETISITINGNAVDNEIAFTAGNIDSAEEKAAAAAQTAANAFIDEVAKITGVAATKTATFADNVLTIPVQADGKDLTLTVPGTFDESTHDFKADAQKKPSLTKVTLDEGELVFTEVTVTVDADNNSDTITVTSLSDLTVVSAKIDGVAVVIE